MITNEVFKIPDDNPFENDKLNREVVADNLEKIIAATNGSLVLSIDAGWGNGKTTFINMWRKKLDKTNAYKTLYFNAWENDDCEDPLLALIGEIEEELISNQEEIYVTKIKETGKKLLKKAVPTLIKIFTNNALDIEGLDLDDSNKQHIIEGAGKLGEFENYKQQKMSKANFKEALAEYQKNEGRKVIFFIDELDRCRPTFAIETLEKIKHLFNIDNFVFVLALDKRQLSHSIKTLYGQDMDSVGYLRRFIDLEFMLPEPNRITYTDVLLEKYQLRNTNTNYFERYLKAAIEGYNLSLRDIEKLFYSLGLLVPTTPLFLPKDQKYKRVYLEVLGVLYSIFPVLKIKDNELYRKFSNRETVNNGALARISIGEEDRGGCYASIISNIIMINNRLKTDKNVLSNDYKVGREEEYRAMYDLTNLVDQDKLEFKFIQQLEFVDNFVFQQSKMLNDS